MAEEIFYQLQHIAKPHNSYSAYKPQLMYIKKKGTFRVQSKRNILNPYPNACFTSS